MTELTLDLSESMVLPFDVVSYAHFLERDLDKIESRYTNLAANNGATFGNSHNHIIIFLILPFLVGYHFLFQNTLGKLLLISGTLPNISLTLFYHVSTLASALILGHLIEFG
jgi:hypothetical protein